jgi:RNA polymerase primary sigma factor
MMRETPALTAAQEQRLAGALSEAREALVEILLRAPRAVRDVAWSAAPGPAAPGPQRSYEELGACCERLERLAPGKVPPGDRRFLAEVARRKRRLDRARDDLFLSGLRFVPHVARNYTHPGISFTDLVQEGNIGLLRAVDRFDHERGVRFSTYAYWWIRQAISKAMAEKSGLVRVPEHVAGRLRRFRRASAQLESRLGRAPSLEEIAREMRIPGEEIDRLLATLLSPYPLSGSGGENEDEILDGLTDPNASDPLQATLSRESQEGVAAALELLSPRERAIVDLRFGLSRDVGLSLEDVGKRVGLCRERVRQILNQALARIQGGQQRVTLPAANGRGCA